MRSPAPARYHALFLLLVSGLTAFHLWYVNRGFLDLTPDEAYY